MSLPAKTTFEARGTHVDNVGQIYMHLYEDRRKFREVRRQLDQLTSLADQEERSQLPGESGPPGDWSGSSGLVSGGIGQGNSPQV